MFNELSLFASIGDRQHASQLANVSEVCAHFSVFQSAEVASDPLLNEDGCSKLVLPLYFSLSGLITQILNLLLSLLLDHVLSI